MDFFEFVFGLMFFVGILFYAVYYLSVQENQDD